MTEDALILCHLNDLPRGETRGFDPANSGEDQVFAVHDDAGVRVFQNLCPHERRPLGLRKHQFLSGDRQSIMCYAHGALFNPLNGLCFAGPCKGDYLQRLSSEVNARGELTISPFAVRQSSLGLQGAQMALGAEAFDVTVSHLYYETDSVVALRLVAVDSRTLPSFSAGAHVDVELRQGIVRPYSIVNAPHERDHYLLGIQIKGPASLSTEVICQLTAGDRLRIGLPRNGFELATQARHHVLLAAGIGITPLLSMASHLANAGESFELHYCARNPTQAPFLNRLNQSNFADRTRFYFSDRGGENRLNFLTALGQAEVGKHAYVCGPERFLIEARTQAHALIWNAQCLHQESFELKREDPK